MAAPICWAIAQNTAKIAINFVDAPASVRGDTKDSPIADPNVRKTNESAAAIVPPANTALHSTKLVPGAAAVRTEPVVADMSTIANSSYVRSAKAQETQNHHDDDHEADEVNDAVHSILHEVTRVKRSTIDLTGFSAVNSNGK
jgi:hypothetical protein